MLNIIDAVAILDWVNIMDTGEISILQKHQNNPIWTGIEIFNCNLFIYISKLK